jgi:hypothetical protein
VADGFDAARPLHTLAIDVGFTEHAGVKCSGDAGGVWNAPAGISIARVVSVAHICEVM